MNGKVLSNHHPCPELPLDPLLDSSAIMMTGDQLRPRPSYIYIASLFALKKQALCYRDRKYATAYSLYFFVGHAKQLPVVFAHG